MVFETLQVLLGVLKPLLKLLTAPKSWTGLTDIVANETKNINLLDYFEKFNTYHGDIILNRSNYSVFLCAKIYWSLGNLNQTRNVLSPGFFLQMLDSIFRSIYLGVSYKLLLQLFLICFCLFCSKIGKRSGQRYHLISG